MERLDLETVRDDMCEPAPGSSDQPDSPRIARALQHLTEELNTTPATTLPGTTARSSTTSEQRFTSSGSTWTVAVRVIGPWG